jgi:hypothetical protein
VAIPALALEQPPHGSSVEHPNMSASAAGELEVEVVSSHIPQVGH